MYHIYFMMPEEVLTITENVYVILSTKNALNKSWKYNFLVEQSLMVCLVASDGTLRFRLHPLCSANILILVNITVLTNSLKLMEYE